MRHSQRIKEAIKTIIAPGTDKERLLFLIALNNPAVVLKAACLNNKKKWMENAENYLNNPNVPGNKILAIKAVRKGGQFKSLKEAKEAVEYFQAYKRWPTLMII